MIDDSPCHSKILLFGEYSIIMNSMALAIPYTLFKGKLEFKQKGELSKNSDAELRSFCQYIRSLESRGELNGDIDVDSFEFDISQGLRFQSSIPQGFGVGSSGALCAAVYRAYAKKKKETIGELKEVFSMMESHFHGASSGIDPLISYLNESILIQEKKKIGQVNIPSYTTGEGCVFLLNTGRARRTEPLVNLFLEKCKNPEFNAICKEQLLPVTNRCITSFLEGDTEGLLRYFQSLSRFQFEHFNPMIPKLFQNLWLEGHVTGDYSLKLCGAGGGGFFLGIAPNFKTARMKLSDHELRPLFWF